MGRSPKKKSAAQLKKILWKLFSAYIRRRDKGICFTCGKRAEGSMYQAGHFIKASVGGIVLYFNEDNVHGQCNYCNIFLDGNQYEYGIRLGAETVDELYRIRQENKNVQWSRDEFEQKIAYYKNLLGT